MNHGSTLGFQALVGAMLEDCPQHGLQFRELLLSVSHGYRPTKRPPI